VPSRLFALCPHSLNLFVRLFPSIHNYSLPEFFGYQWIFNRALVSLIALLLTGFFFIPFSTAHSPKVSRPFCNFSMSFLFVIFLQIIQSSANSLIRESFLGLLRQNYNENNSDVGGERTLVVSNVLLIYECRWVVEVISCVRNRDWCVKPSAHCDVSFWILRCYQ
jgi:hypothetical protein